MKYVVVDIGCIECGEASSVLGIFDKETEAKKILKQFSKIQSDNWTGQHYFEIFEVRQENIPLYTEEEYLKYIKW